VGLPAAQPQRIDASSSQVFKNALLYNPPVSPIAKWAAHLWKLFERDFARITEEENGRIADSRFEFDPCKLCCRQSTIYFEAPVYYCAGSRCANLESGRIRRCARAAGTARLTGGGLQERDVLCGPGQQVLVPGLPRARSAGPELRGEEEQRGALGGGSWGLALAEGPGRRLRG
jgi:hypothetical protein